MDLLDLLENMQVGNGKEEKEDGEMKYGTCVFIYVSIKYTHTNTHIYIYIYIYIYMYMYMYMYITSL